MRRAGDKINKSEEFPSCASSSCAHSTLSSTFSAICVRATYITRVEGTLSVRRSRGNISVATPVFTSRARWPLTLPCSTASRRLERKEVCLARTALDQAEETDELSSAGFGGGLPPPHRRTDRPPVPQRRRRRRLDAPCPARGDPYPSLFQLRSL